VRNEVGNHAQVLNKIIALQESSVPCLDRKDFANAKPGSQNNNSELKFSKLLPLNENSAACTSTIAVKQLDTKSSLETSSIDPLEMSVLNCVPLSESVGHTRVQVFVGALLGFAISLIIDAIL
jgi:acid phosphatase family membrane protein YuiD